MNSTVIPCLRYREAKRMLDWLCEVFGFERHAVYDDGQGGVAHAELTLGSGMIRLGSAKDEGFLGCWGGRIPAVAWTTEVRKMETNG